MSQLRHIVGLLLCALSLVLVPGLSAHAAPLKIDVIPREQARTYVENLFRTPLLKGYAHTPGNIIYDVVSRSADHPLFVFKASDHPASRLNFTAYLRLLSLRHADYENPIFGDLYLLHELYHMVSMPYGLAESFEQWEEKMTLNEKESTLFSEAVVHVAFPEIRKVLPIPEIWADRFLSEKIQLKPGISNHDLYLSSPLEYLSRMGSHMSRIKTAAFSDLDPIERRTWAYDRSNEVWSHVYWKFAPAIESHMKKFYDLSPTDQFKAAQKHVDWLMSISTDELILPEPAEDFYRFYKRLVDLHLDPRLENFCAQCEVAAKRIDQLVAENKVEMTPAVPAAQKLLRMGVSGIVYSFITPETRAITEKSWKTTDFGEIYGEAFTRKQDVEHRAFIEAYRQWAKPVVKGLEGFKNAYPSNGSNEAIKDTLALIRAHSPAATLHVFEGEYEGVIAYAAALGIELKKHPRTRASVENIAALTLPGDIFYLSQPSGLDGNVWNDFDAFMQSSQVARLRVLVDLAYVGAVAKKFEIDVDYPHVEAVFFSLSKAFGTYYQRIGGVFSRRPNPMLYGNMWFKNLLSIRIGTEMLKAYGVHELARKYLWAQTAGVLDLSKKLGRKLISSDVIQLAYYESKPADVAQDFKILYRGSQDEGYVRFCLTPLLSALVDEPAQKACETAFATEAL